MTESLMAYRSETHTSTEDMKWMNRPLKHLQNEKQKWAIHSQVTHWCKMYESLLLTKINPPWEKQQRQQKTSEGLSMTPWWSGVGWRRQQIARKEPLNHKSHGDNARLSVVMATLRRFCGWSHLLRRSLPRRPAWRGRCGRQRPLRKTTWRCWGGVSVRRGDGSSGSFQWTGSFDSTH